MHMQAFAISFKPLRFIFKLEATGVLSSAGASGRQLVGSTTLFYQQGCMLPQAHAFPSCFLNSWLQIKALCQALARLGAYSRRNCFTVSAEGSPQVYSLFILLLVGVCLRLLAL